MTNFQPSELLLPAKQSTFNANANKNPICYSSLSLLYTEKMESYRLEIESQFDIQYRLNLTQVFSNYSESRVEF